MQGSIVLTDAFGLQASGVGSFLAGFIAFEKGIGRFTLAGGAIVVGSVVAATGVVATTVLVAAVPETFGLSATLIPASLGVIAGGGYLIAFGTDIYLIEINAFLGTQISGPGDISPGFPRFEPIFNESILRKLQRLRHGSAGSCS